MEKYYFIEKDGAKLGPFKLDDLKSQIIYFDELVWRSDSENWKKASEYEELHEYYIIKPPLTPIEEKNKNFNEYFFKTIVVSSIVVYIIISLLISVTSFSIATNSWTTVKNKYLINKEEVGQNNYHKESQNLNSDTEQLLKERERLNQIEQYVNPILQRPSLRNINRAEQDSINMYEGIKYRISELQRDSSYRRTLIFWTQTGNLPTKVEPIYKIPQNIISSEDDYSRGQSILFRAYYAFYSKIYLTIDEQNNFSKLFLNITLSSFLSLLILLLIFLISYYLAKQVTIK